MSQIHIIREHPFTAEEARSRVDVLRDQLKTKLGIDANWQGEQLKFKGRGATGAITVTENQVEVKIKLGLLLSALAPKLEEKITQGLDEAISQA